jgi:hypothetical protein
MGKLRPFGEIMLDMEKLLFELHGHPDEGGHDMQHGEVLYAINGWQKIHVPDQIETYEKDGKHPVLYGPKKKRKSRKK